MNLKPSTIATTLFWCLFMGVTVISIGAGAVFPQLNYVAGPLICPGGTMSTSQQGYNVSPVRSVTTVTMYCIDGKTGTRNEVDVFPTCLFSGLIYGLLLFFVVFAVMLIRAQGSGKSRRPDPSRD